MSQPSTIYERSLSPPNEQGSIDFQKKRQTKANKKAAKLETQSNDDDEEGSIIMELSDNNRSDAVVGCAVQ